MAELRIAAFSTILIGTARLILSGVNALNWNKKEARFGAGLWRSRLVGKAGQGAKRNQAMSASAARAPTRGPDLPAREGMWHRPHT